MKTIDFTSNLISDSMDTIHIKESTKEDNRTMLLVSTITDEKNNSSRYYDWLDMASFESAEKFFEFFKQKGYLLEDTILVVIDSKNLNKELIPNIINGIDSYDCINDIIAYAKCQHKDAMDTYIEYLPDYPLSKFKYHYIGKFYDCIEFAEYHTQAYYGIKSNDSFAKYINYESLAQDLFNGCYAFFNEFVFIE